MTENKFNIEEFAKKNNCSKENLEKLFSKRIIKDIIKYTKKHAFPSWRKVNYKKRNGIKLNYFEQKFYDNISFAIRNFTLNEDCVVYRGFATNMDDLKAKGLMDENNEIVIGKIIPFEGLVSTSLSKKVAETFSAKSSERTPQNDILIIYQISVNNFNALPIFSISSNKNEQEVLLNNVVVRVEDYNIKSFVEGRTVINIKTKTVR